MNQNLCALIAAFSFALVGCEDDATITIDPTDIVNGDPVSEADFPGVGMLIDFDTSGLCSGTLISERVVLTAAHCLPDDGDLSSLRFSLSATFSPNSVWVDVVDSRTQFEWPGGDSGLTRGDIAVVELAQAVVLPQYPELLADSSILRPAILGGDFDVMAIVGYGLNEIEQSGVKRAGLVGFYSWVNSAGAFTATKSDFQLYAPLEGFEQLACPGDSGGPAFLLTASGPVIAGVTHAGTRDQGLCDSGNLSFYSPVVDYRDWIVAKTLELDGVFGDVDRDGALGTGDLDAFGVAFRSGTYDPSFDFDNDGDVDALDGDVLVLDLVSILYGDIDADGDTDGADFLAMQRSFGKTTGRWTDGDMNFDGVTDALDQDAWERNYGRLVTAPGADAKATSSKSP